MGALDGFSGQQNVAPQGATAAPATPSPMDIMNPMMYGAYNPLSALWMMGSQMSPGASQQLGRAGESMLAGATQSLPGALSRMQSARDSAAEEKMAAISRAMTALTQPPSVNMQQLAAGAGFLAPTRTGSVFESFGNAAQNTLQQAVAQRAFEQENALRLAQLGLQKAGIPEENAAQEVQDIYGRFNMGQKAEENAALADYRREMGAGRIAMANARVSAAQIMANKGRFKYLGADPNAQDPQNPGVYLDQMTGQHVYGPAAQMAHALTPNEAASLARFDYAHRPLKADGTPADPPPEGQGLWMKRRIAYYMQHPEAAQAAAAPAPQAAPVATSKPTAPGATQPWLHVPALMQNGKPVRPDGVPDNAIYSGTTKSWWWQGSPPQR